MRRAYGIVTGAAHHISIMLIAEQQQHVGEPVALIGRAKHRPGGQHGARSAYRLQKLTSLLHHISFRIHTPA